MKNIYFIYCITIGSTVLLISGSMFVRNICLHNGSIVIRLSHLILKWQGHLLVGFHIRGGVIHLHQRGLWALFDTMPQDDAASWFKTSDIWLWGLKTSNFRENILSTITLRAAGIGLLAEIHSGWFDNCYAVHIYAHNISTLLWNTCWLEHAFGVI